MDEKDPTEQLHSRRLRQVVDEALSLPASERSGFLEACCGSDADLRREAELRLEKEERGSTLLDGRPPGRVSLAEGLATPATWEAFLQQLRSRGPGHGRYQDEGEVARGGMGSIRRVYDEDLRRRLALKRILPPSSKAGSSQTATSLGRFLEEAQVASQLDHPGIVPVHELGVDSEGRVYFTMKLVKGEDLRSVLDRSRDPSDREWTETRVLGALLRVCEAMAYAHSKGVIHRDLKPANVMVGKFGEVYVMDWGLARVLGEEDGRDIRLQPDPGSLAVRSERRDRSGNATGSPLLTMDGDAVGTPAYMPPEQAAGRQSQVGPASDVYAVGAMLYHLLTGRMPYVEAGDRITPHTLLALVLAGPPRPVHELRKDVPAELEAICEKAMNRRIEERYTSMERLAQDLRAYLEHRVVEAYESGPIAELKKWVKRNPGITRTAAAAGLILGVILWWSFISIREQRDSAEKNEKSALAQKDRADRNADEIAARQAEFDQLAGVVHLENALAAEAQLHPAWPEKVEPLQRWLDGDAAELLALKPTILRTISDLESRARSGTASAGPGGASYSLLFSEESQEFLYRTLSQLSDRLSEFESQVLPDVEERLAWARRIDELSRLHPNGVATWDEARESIAAADGVLASELYREQPIDLQPQMGLVPIGKNPVTGLWEFYDLRTAFDPASGLDPAEIMIPEHREDGTLEIRESTGLVFVLIPGGTYRIGAQSSDPEAPHHDPQAESDESPVHEVVLEPYFISRYEMTQGQWMRMVGETPSQYDAESYLTDWNAMGLVADLTHPVENVSWDECRLHLPRFGMRLPSAAQWEAACRAGTETPWWTGSDLADLDEAGNLADQYARAHGGPTGWGYSEELNDGNSVHARVGSYRANAFGLHDVIGNVWEWCVDDRTVYTTPGRDGDGARFMNGALGRVFRGGGFEYSSGSARSAHRGLSKPSHRNSALGCRPGRELLAAPAEH